MKLAIMQPYFFPYIGYFQAIHAVDKFMLYDNLTFIKEAWMNRNRFLVRNGKPTFFYAELKEKSSFKKIFEIELVESHLWRRRILKSIYLNYKKAPYFETVYPLIESIVNYPTSKLTELNYQSITQVCNYLQLDSVVGCHSDEYTDLEVQLAKEIIDPNDFPDIAMDNFQRKTIRVLSICKKENVHQFVNAIGGMKLYDKKDFFNNGIELSFVKTLEHHYKQHSSIFYPNLSIIDVLMNCGKEGTNKLIGNYELI